MKRKHLIFAGILFLTQSLLVTTTNVSADSKSYVKIKLDEAIQRPDLPTKQAKKLKEFENRVVPEFLTQEEINRLIGQQTQKIQPESGFGMVVTELANKFRSNSYCSATPTIYNYSNDYINQFYGMIDIYQQRSTNGVYQYSTTSQAPASYIPPTVNFGYALARKTYTNFALGQYWDFSGNYDVMGSDELPLSHVRWNCL